MRVHEDSEHRATRQSDRAGGFERFPLALRLCRLACRALVPESKPMTTTLRPIAFAMLLFFSSGLLANDSSKLDLENFDSGSNACDDF